MSKKTEYFETKTFTLEIDLNLKYFVCLCSTKRFLENKKSLLQKEDSVL